MAASKPVQHGPWPDGMDNVSPDHDVARSALRHAGNVDILDNGDLRLRAGITSRGSTTAHSLWSDKSSLYAVVGGSLTRLTRTPSGGLDSVVLRTGLSTTSPVGYTRVGSDVFYSNVAVNGKIVGGVHRPWGVEPPSGQPAAAAVASGTLFAGRYQVAVTFVDNLGEESGTGATRLVTVVEGSSIALASIPQPATSTVTKIRVYMTEANGAVLYRQVDYPVGTTSATLNRSINTGAPLRTQFMFPPLPGRIVEVYNGRIYVARTNSLYATEPQRYGLMRHNSFMQFEDEIRIVADGGTGLWVVTATDSVFLSGNGPEDFTPIDKLPYGAPRGAITELPGGRLFWMSTRGPVVVNLQGDIEDMTDEDGEPLLHVATESGASGAAAYMETDGVRQVVTCVRGDGRRALVAQDYLDLTGTFA